MGIYIQILDFYSTKQFALLLG